MTRTTEVRTLGITPPESFELEVEEANRASAEGTPWRYAHQEWQRKLARERIESVKSGKCEPVYAVVVETSRHYGGPEEGGWWYDWSEVVEVRRAWTFKSLLKTVRELREEHPTCPRGRSSVIGGADVAIYLVRYEDSIESLQSRERPTYC